MKERGIVVDRSSSVPLQRQLESSLRDAIVSGRMSPGERLLSSRELQTHLGVSRNTIVNAVAQLRAEGYLECIRSVGTFVAEALHVRAHYGAEEVQSEEVELPSRFASRSAEVQSLAANLSRSAPFRPGVPALDLFPLSAFQRCVRSESMRSGSMDYPQACGDFDLRAAIAQRLRQTRGVDCSPDQILVTCGAQSGFVLIGEVLLETGSVVLTEEPGYPSARAAFLAMGSVVRPIDVDAQGIQVTTLRGTSATLVHVSPSHQHPTGAVLPLDRRYALLDWAEKNGAWIVEDDYDSEFNYTGKPQPALFGLGNGRRVIYVGTFSKALSPALRVGYIVVPRALRDAFKAVHTVTGAQPSVFIQRALGKFMAEGHFARHITKMRKIYNERRITTSMEFARAFGSAAQIRDTRAGLHFVVRLAPEIPAEVLSERAAGAGYIVPALSSYCVGTSKMNGVVIGYAATSMDVARRAVRDLVRLAKTI